MKNRNFRTLKGLRQRQAGYTLVELAITVSIIAVLIVGTLTGVQRLLRSNNSNSTLTQTQVAVTNIAKVVATAGKGVYGGAGQADGTNVLAQLGVWDASAVTTSAAVPPVRTVTNPFSGSITVSPNTAPIGGANGAAANTGYWYRIGGVPEDICPSLASSFVNTAAGIYIDTPGAGDSLSVTNGVAYKTPGLPALSTANLATGCTGNTGGTVQIALFILT
jgi:prepilin-type N-terminal cleavage/methylation domain-containing protein